MQLHRPRIYFFPNPSFSDTQAIQAKMSAYTRSPIPGHLPVTAVDFTVEFYAGSAGEKQVKAVADYLGVCGWVSTASRGRLIGRAEGTYSDVADFRRWLQYVARGYASMNPVEDRRETMLFADLEAGFVIM